MAKDNYYTVVGMFDSKVSLKINAIDRSKLPKFLKDALHLLKDTEFENYSLFVNALKDTSVIEVKDTHLKKISKLLNFGGRFDILRFNENHIMPNILRKFGGVELEISFEPYKRNRSGKQNRYLHGVVIPTITAFELRRGTEWIKNLTRKEATEVIKAYIYDKVLNNTFIEKNIGGYNVIAMVDKRMSDMNTEEFSNAVETIRDFYNEIGCYIPEPTKDSFIADYINKR